MKQAEFSASTEVAPLSLSASGFVGLVGEANAGKSTLLNALLGEKISIVTNKSHTTRNRILGIRTRNDYQIVFVDTPGFVGQAKQSALGKMLERETSQAIAEVEVVVLVVDVSKAVSNLDYVSKLLSVLKRKELSLPGIICLNKMDLIDRRAILPLIARLSQELLQENPGLEIIPISAKTGDGLEVLEKSIVKALPAGPMYFPSDVTTDQSEQVYVSELIRERYFSYLQEELPYSLAVEVEEWRETDELISIGAVVYVERASQKGIVIGAGGKLIKKVGMAVREELERFWGIKVNLRLFVRVQANWTQTSQGLSRVGIISR